MAKKIVITGASGFVGSRLLPLLKKDIDIEVIAFEGDLTEVSQVEEFFTANRGVDQIVHLAGLAAGTDLVELFRINVLATQNLLVAATARGVKKVILASSSGVYGEPIDKLSREGDELRTDSLYGLSKRWAEDVVGYWHLNKGVGYIILRFASIYGLGNAKGSVYSIQKSIEETGEVTVYGGGTQSRSFVHVDDACRAIVKAIGFTGSGIFNITSPETLTINGLVRKFAQTKKFKIIKRPANNTSKDLVMDGAKAKEKLGFEPKRVEMELDV